MIFPEFCDGLRNRPEETLIQIPCQPLLTEILESDEQQTHNSCFEESFPLLLPSEEQQSDSDYFDLVFSSLSPWQSSIDTPESSIDISESYIDLSEWLEFAPELNSMNNEQSAAKDQPVTPQLDLSTSQKEDLVSQQQQ